MAAIMNRSTHLDILPSPRDNLADSGQEDGGSREFEFKPHLNSQLLVWNHYWNGYFFSIL
jgi:hypothetical protein